MTFLKILDSIRRSCRTEAGWLSTAGWEGGRSWRSVVQSYFYLTRQHEQRGNHRIRTVESASNVAAAAEAACTLVSWTRTSSALGSRLRRAFMPESQVSDALGGRLRISLNIQICSSPDSAGRRQRGRRIYGRRGGRAARRQPRRPECSAGATGGATRGFWYVLIMISYGMDIHIPQRARSLAAPARTGRERGSGGRRGGRLLRCPAPFRL